MVDDTLRLGYGGSASVDGIQVLVTSGNFENTSAISYLESYDVKPTGGSRSRVKHADGTNSYSASLSLDVTNDFLTVLTTTKLLSRGYSFDIGLHDGNNARILEDCYLQSLSVSGAAEGIINANLSAISAKSPVPSIAVKNSFIRNQSPIGYWYSGNTDVRDWTLTMNQAVSPSYTNQNVVNPRYIKVGLIDFNLSVTTYQAVVAHSTINITTSSFTLTGDTSSTGFAFTGTTDLGNYTHSFDTSAIIGFALGGSDGIIIT